MPIRCCSRRTREISTTVIRNPDQPRHHPDPGAAMELAVVLAAALAQATAAVMVRVMVATAAAAIGVKVAAVPAVAAVAPITTEYSAAKTLLRRRAAWKSPNRNTPKRRARIRSPAR